MILTGALDDGSAGLAVKNAGGTAVVQDPADAAVSDMPTHALELVEADYQVRADGLAPLLVGLVKSDVDLPAIRHQVPLETVEEATMQAEARRADEIDRAFAAGLVTRNPRMPCCPHTAKQWNGHSGLRFASSRNAVP